MTNSSARLARSITWAASKQSYFTARLLADRELADDCLRAYAYFRWADDKVDITPGSRQEGLDFIQRQKCLVESLYRGEHVQDPCPEEEMLVDLISHDRLPDSGLKSFIWNFLAVIEFDAMRRGRASTRQELAAYTNCLSTAVMDGLQYFIGNSHRYAKTQGRLLAVTGAHITHMLRDTLEDLEAGLVNIPEESLKALGLDPAELNVENLRPWVREQVQLARKCIASGKIYIEGLDNLRCKLAGILYCARFECVLHAIEKDGYGLRREYHQRHTRKAWLGVIRLGATTILRHYFGRTGWLPVRAAVSPKFDLHA